MYLSDENKKEIAGLISSIMFNKEKWYEAIDHRNYDDAEEWHRDYAQDIVELSTRFDIHLAGAKECMRFLNDD